MVAKVTMGWKAECEEWQAIKDEPSLRDKPGWPFVANDISLEQRKRMAARGQRPMTYEEILHEHARETGLCTCAPIPPSVGTYFGPFEDGMMHQLACPMVKAREAAARQ